MKTYEVNFDGNVLAEIIVNDDKIVVTNAMNAMNGYGIGIAIDDIKIKEKK